MLQLQKKISYSVLDLAPIAEGKTPADALKASLNLAQHAEKMGYNRFWVAEHHNMVNVASVATPILIGYIAGGTKSIRVGSGGIMLPNHAPLIVAEQFGTLASLYPNRIDLGLGRAPGTDQLTANEIRTDRMQAVHRFPDEIRKIQQYFQEDRTNASVRSILSEGVNVPFYILGSSTDSAYLAAEMGLPYAFASHFAPAQLYHALKIYRERFVPSEHLKEPYVIVASSTVIAESEEEAEFLASSTRRMAAGILTNRREKMQPPVENFNRQLSPDLLEAIYQMQACALIGGKEKVKNELKEFMLRTQADEIMAVSYIYDQEKRIYSYQLLKEIADELNS